MEETDSNKSNPIVLITGGSGFLGQAIVTELLDKTSAIQPQEIRVFDRQPFKTEFPENVKYIAGDVTDLAALTKACAGVDLVMHAAAIIDWGTKDESEVLAINLGGTQNVIEACKANGIAHLIFTSSLDAVYTGKALNNIDESCPYPNTFATSYCKSKTLAEQAIIAAESEQLHTCILRPADIYGEADPYHIDPLIDMAKNGFYVRLGNGSAKCQHIYVRNMAHAHILAGHALLTKNAAVYRNAYFITDGPPTNFFTFFDEVVLRAGYTIRPKNLWLSKPLAYTMASIAEFGAWLISPIKKFNVKFSRFAVTYTCTNFTFTANKAKADFGFTPKYSTAEALGRTAKYYAI